MTLSIFSDIPFEYEIVEPRPELGIRTQFIMKLKVTYLFFQTNLKQKENANQLRNSYKFCLEIIIQKRKFEPE